MFRFFLSFQSADKAMDILKHLEVDVNMETMLIQYIGTGVLKKAFGKFETCDRTSRKALISYCFGFVCFFSN